jgi:hypothetical protein
MHHVLQKLCMCLSILATTFLLLSSAAISDQRAKADEPILITAVECAGDGDTICRNYPGTCEDPPRDICHTPKGECWCAYEGDPANQDCRCKPQ